MWSKTFNSVFQEGESNPVPYHAGAEDEDAVEETSQPEESGHDSQDLPNPAPVESGQALAVSIPVLIFNPATLARVTS